MRYNDKRAAVKFAFGTTGERANSRTARTLYASHLLRIHTLTRLAIERGVFGVLRDPCRSPATDGFFVATPDRIAAPDGPHQNGCLWRHMLPCISYGIPSGRTPSIN